MYIKEQKFYVNYLHLFLGNHESATMNHMYGFEGEVKAKYTAQMAELFTEVYNWLPLAHCLNGRVLVCIYYFYFITPALMICYICYNKNI